MGVTADARNNISRDESVLPQAAKSILNDNFKAKISLIKIDKSFGSVKEFEVILNDGTEISFDKNGNWNEIEMPGNKSVPGSFVLKNISDYIKKVHSGQKIVGIEKERGGFNIELSNGIDMKFDKSGNFLRYD